MVLVVLVRNVWCDILVNVFWFIILVFFCVFWFIVVVIVDCGLIEIVGNFLSGCGFLGGY